MLRTTWVQLVGQVQAGLTFLALLAEPGDEVLPLALQLFSLGSRCVHAFVEHVRELAGVKRGSMFTHGGPRRLRILRSSSRGYAPCMQRDRILDIELHARFDKTLGRHH